MSATRVCSSLAAGFLGRWRVRYDGRAMPSVPPISSILIKPAGPDCNLACDYCFYRPKAVLYPDGPPVHRMTEAVLEAVVGQYMSLAGPRPVLAWQGGEPTLMGLDFYRAAVEFEQRLGKPGQVVGNGFQTNGVLLDDEWARFFARYKFLVGVSLDGPRELHDLHRRDASGAPTFERVMRGIDALRRGGVEFNVLCMVTRESVGRPEELFEFFLAKDLRHLQFIPLVEPGAEPLTAAEFSVAPEDYGEFLCRLFDLWAGEWPPPLGIRIFDELLSAYAGQPAPSCTFPGIRRAEERLWGAMPCVPVAADVPRRVPEAQAHHVARRRRGELLLRGVSAAFQPQSADAETTGR